MVFKARASAGVAHFALCLMFALPASLAVVPISHAADPSQPMQTVAYGRAWGVVSTTLNGRPVLIVQDGQTNKFDFGLQVAAGYYADPEQYDGVAHLAEHMIAWGQLPRFGESLRQWQRKDQARNLWFHTDSTSTTFYLSCDVGDAGELLDRFDEAIIRTAYTAEDVDGQLREIDGERKPYESSASGVLVKTLGNLANQSHPYHRVFSSGGEAVLGHTASPELVAQVNEFLKLHYPGNQSALVVMSPNPPEQVLDLLRNHLSAMLGLPAAAPMPAAYRDIEAFSPATRAALQEARYPTQTDQLVIEYAVPNAMRRRSSRALELMEFALSDGTLNSLDSKLKSLGDALNTAVDIDTDELDGADNVLVRITLTTQGAAQVDHVYSAIKAQIKTLLSANRHALTSRFVSSTEQRTLFSAQPARKPMIFDALDAVAAGRGAKALDYKVSVSDQDWADFQSLRSSVNAMTPVHIHFKGTGGGQTRLTAGKIGTHAPSLPTPEAMSFVEHCVLGHPEDTSPCLQPYWGIEARRSTLPLLDGLQRSIAGALLQQSKQTIESQLSGAKNALQVFAYTVPAIAVYGYGDDRSLILKKAWAEFLRERTAGELAEIKAQLVDSPHDAYDLAETTTRTLLDVSDGEAAGNIQSIAELKLLVAAIQARYRSAPIDDYGIDAGTPSESETGQGNATPLPPPAMRSIHYLAGSTFKASSLLDLQCSRASPRLQTLLRVAAGPAHRLILSTVRASTDPSAFGAYPVWEWGDQLCYGISLDSSVLSADEIHVSKDALAQAVESLFCEISPEKWDAMKQATLVSEGSLWSRDQAFALKDIRNWMRNPAPVLPAREVRGQAADLRSQDVCNWMKTNNSELDSASTHIDVLIERAH